MPETVTPYIERHPRDLITAEDWNHVQMLIKKDIEERLEKAIAAINLVPKSGDSAKLAGKTPEELAQDIIDSALQEVNKRTGYMRIFRKLQVTEPDADDKDVKVSLIEHALKDFPVTDVYQLEFFDVICSEDDVKEKESVLFYLYHSSEKKIKTRDSGNQPVEAEIEPPGDIQDPVRQDARDLQGAVRQRHDARRSGNGVLGSVLRQAERRVRGRRGLPFTVVRSLLRGEADRQRAEEARRLG
jgi:hypothetical protein